MADRTTNSQGGGSNRRNNEHTWVPDMPIETLSRVLTTVGYIQDTAELAVEKQREVRIHGIEPRL